MADLYAFLTESLDDEHEAAVLKGVIAGARENQDLLLCLPGRTVASSVPERRARNFVFDLVPDEAKGILVLSGSIANDISPEVLREWLQRFGERPMCCMGVPVPGCRNVEVDNEGGLSGVVEHLIAQHSARTIAFIGGPRAGAEAAVRLAAFRSTMKRAGLEVDERLVVEGDYTRESGERAIRVLLHERRHSTASLDAVVAANDYMAIGAMEELARLGVQVPGQIKVVGFDDMESARAAHPRLTTVRQPAFQQGLEGFRLLRDGTATSEMKLPTELVVRHSCGCDDTTLHLASRTSLGAGLGVQTSLVQRRQVILAELMRAAGGSFGGAGMGWESRLLDGLISDLRGVETRALARELGHLLSRMTRAPHDALLIQDVLTALRDNCLPSVSSDPKARDRLEASVHEARALAGVLAAQSVQSHALRSYRAFVRTSRRFGRAMFRTRGELAQTAAEELPALGITAAVVAALEPDPLRGTVLFGFGLNGPFTSSEPVSLRRLHRHSVFEHASGTLIALPLVRECEPLGVALICTGGVEGVLYEELADLLATVLLVVTQLTG